MLYTNTFIIKLLQHFITNNSNKENSLRLISFQELAAEVILAALKNQQQGKLCYLLPGEDFYHALVITYEGQKIAYQYVLCFSQPTPPPNSLNQKTLALVKNTLQTIYCDKFTDKKFENCYIKISANTIPIAFTETLRQLLLSEKTPHIDAITTARKDLTFFIHQLAEIKKTQITEPLRLIIAYSTTIQFLGQSPATYLTYPKIKNFFHQKTISFDDCVTSLVAFLNEENLSFIISKENNTAECLLAYLKILQEELSVALLKTEQTKILVTTPREILTTLYYTSTIGMYDQLAVAIATTLQPLHGFDLKSKSIKNFTLEHAIKLGGIATGSYLLFNSGLYFAIKPPLIFISSELVARYLTVENFHRKNAETITTRFFYFSNHTDWYFIISNLFLLIEVLYAEDSRSLTYGLGAIATNLLFTQLAKWVFPIFQEDPDSPNTEQVHSRITVLMLITLLSRLFSNTVADYGYAALDEQNACEQATDEFTHSIQNQTTALEVKCHRAAFWKSAPPKLIAQATDQQGETFAITCNVQQGIHKFSECDFQSYPNKLLMPSL